MLIAILFVRKESCCPVDSKPLKRDNAHLFRDNCTSREISQQRTNCPYQQFGCEVQLSPIDMEKHVEECALRGKAQTIRCTFGDVGCTESFRTEEGLQRHLEANVNTHLTVRFSWYFIYLCSVEKIVLYQHFIFLVHCIDLLLCFTNCSDQSI